MCDSMTDAWYQGSGLGMFRDNQASLLAAVQYLTRWESAWLPI